MTEQAKNVRKEPYKIQWCSECKKRVSTIHIGDGWYRCERENNHEIPPPGGGQRS